MSATLIAVLFYLGLGLAALHVVVACGFVLRLLTSRSDLPDDAACPAALVVVCLRGADPSLRRCLDGLFKQNYPKYDVVAVIDDPEDPAWQVVHEAAAAAGAKNIVIERLEQRPTTCSLKCAALLQAWRHADRSYAVIATIDADVVPHSTWLRELVAPLADVRFGAVSGNRWYRPDPVSWGSAMRYLWNAGAVVPMYWHGIAWGGSLAMRADVLQRTDYADRVGRALCEDVMLRDVLRRAGLRLGFVPNLLMVNREDCTAASFLPWMRRQTLIMKLYHGDSPAILTHGLLSGGYFAAAVVALGAAVGLQDESAMRQLGISLAAFVASLAGPVPMMHAAVRRIVRRRGEVLPTYSLAEWLRLAIALPLTQITYAAIVASVLRARRVEWRGIYYRIDGPLKITRENDGAFQAAADQDSNQSL